MKRWHLWVGVSLSVLLLWAALHDLDLRELWKALRGANLAWLVPGISLYFVGLWVRAWRWRILLGPIHALPARRLFPVLAIGFMGNNIYPARAGEVLRALVLRRRYGTPMSASVATILIERVLDGLVLVGLVLFGMPELARHSIDPGLRDQLQAITRWGIVGFGGLVACIVLGAFHPSVVANAARWSSARLLGGRLQARLGAASERFVLGLSCLRSAKSSLHLGLTSIMIWVIETGEYWLVMQAFPFEVSFRSLLLMNGTANLVSTLPSAPGYIGTFDAPGIAVLSALGVPPAPAAGYTLVLHATLWLPVTAVGAWCIARESRRRREAPADGPSDPR